jgi:hypothetical protein
VRAPTRQDAISSAALLLIAMAAASPDQVRDGILVLRPARSHRATDGGGQQDLLEQFSRHGVDAWTAVQNLAGTQHRGVRDYLINRMYELLPKDVDFFLPQLWYEMMMRLAAPEY